MFIKNNKSRGEKRGKGWTMNVITFKSFFDRLVSATGIKSQVDLATALGVHRSAITQAKTRDAVPAKWVLRLARHFSLSPDWLEFGTGSPRSSQAKGVGGETKAVSRKSTAQRTRELVLHALPVGTNHAANDVMLVPKIAARLCAGGGSFEVEAQPVSTHPFPRWWLAKLGSPSDMVFMDVVGDSMEPGICDGDTVLVDQSYTRVDSHSVLAVGVEDAIYLKRVERCGDGILLHSDNPGYAPMEIFGDELENFRIIGRVVWLCRDCR